MFIHFYADREVRCDDCGNLHSMMHMSLKLSDRSVNLCVPCFRALTKALSRAARKLGVDAQLDTGKGS
jgi:hypothetical protein